MATKMAATISNGGNVNQHTDVHFDWGHLIQRQKKCQTQTEAFFFYKSQVQYQPDYPNSGHPEVRIIQTYGLIPPF